MTTIPPPTAPVQPSTAQPAVPQSATPNLLGRVLNIVGPLIGLIIIFAVFAWLVPDGRFMRAGNLQTIARQATIVSTAALGMTLIIITAGIDLSVGSTVALVTVVVALVLRAGDGPTMEQHPIAWPLFAAAVGIAAGALCGLINGLLIVSLRVVPFIVTLGTLLVFRGVAKGVANEQEVNCPDSWLSVLTATLPKNWSWMIVSPGVWLTILLSLLVAGILRYTVFGRRVFALGSSESTARLCGIPVGRTKILVYVLGGLFASVAGLLQFSRLGQGDPTVADGLELDVIAAVVIGGGSLSGGEGSILGTIIGALIMNVIRAGLSQMGQPTWKQQLITGIIIIVAVALDRLRHRKAA